MTGGSAPHLLCPFPGRSDQRGWQADFTHWFLSSGAQVEMNRPGLVQVPESARESGEHRRRGRAVRPLATRDSTSTRGRAQKLTLSVKLSSTPRLCAHHPAEVVGGQRGELGSLSRMARSLDSQHCLRPSEHGNLRGNEMVGKRTTRSAVADEVVTADLISCAGQQGHDVGDHGFDGRAYGDRGRRPSADGLVRCTNRHRHSKHAEFELFF